MIWLWSIHLYFFIHLFWWCHCLFSITGWRIISIKWHQMITLQFNSNCYALAKLIPSQGGNCNGKVDTGTQIVPYTHSHTHKDWNDCSLRSTLTSAVISCPPAAHFLTIETSITGLCGKKVSGCLSVPQLRFAPQALSVYPHTHPSILLTA